MIASVEAEYRKDSRGGAKCPPALAYLAAAYQQLSNRRTYVVIGNAVMANPVSYSELAAFNRETAAELLVWEKETLIRIDDAVLAIVNREKQDRDRQRSGEARSIPVNDAEGVRLMFERVAKKA